MPESPAEHLPHDHYLDAVYEALEAAGAHPKDSWTETPDGESLDAVVTFEDVDPAEWPDGVYLAWSQKTGWRLITEGSNRTTYDLDLELYSNPQAVAERTASRLDGLPDEPVTEAWDMAETLEQNAARWSS